MGVSMQEMASKRASLAYFDWYLSETDGASEAGGSLRRSPAIDEHIRLRAYSRAMRSLSTTALRLDDSLDPNKTTEVDVLIVRVLRITDCLGRNVIDDACEHMCAVPQFLP